MARPLTRAQRLENRAFLRRLERTGNVRLAAREAGVEYGTIQHRRKGHPDFAQAWDAAVVVARARLNAAAVDADMPSQYRVKQPPAASARPGDERPDTPSRKREGRSGLDPSREREGRSDALRTEGGEAVIVRLKDGTVQVRRAQPGKLTRACEQAFLAALSATCNVRLSAAAAGAAEAAFYRRKRDKPAFAREWRLALQQGYEAVEMALLASGMEGSHDDDAWRHNAPPPVPPMTANQALQLLYLHQKAALNLDYPPYMKRRRGESSEAWSYRLSAMYEARAERDREAFRVMEAARIARGEGPYWDCPKLPDLAQVTGWSKADPDKAAHDETRALFGGWRVEDMEGD